jgi:hypothetical protein
MTAKDTRSIEQRINEAERNILFAKAERKRMKEDVYHVDDYIKFWKRKLRKLRKETS